MSDIGHNSQRRHRVAFQEHHDAAELHGAQSLDHRMKAARALWAHRQRFKKHGTWKTARSSLEITGGTVDRYLLAGEYLEIHQSGEFDDFAHLLRVAGDWRAERDAERERRKAREAREHERAARTEAQTATQAKERERAEQRAEAAAAKARTFDERAERNQAHVEQRRAAHAVLDGHAPAQERTTCVPASGEQEWWTPAELVEAARDVLGVIELDPASCAGAQATVRARRFHTLEDDGLAQEWSGAVWLNPPGS